MSLESIKEKINRIKENVIICDAQPEYTKPDKDGLICHTCDGSGWVERTEENGHTYMDYCPECYSARMTARRLKVSGISTGDYLRYNLDTFDVKRSYQAEAMKNMAVEFLANHTHGQGLGYFGASGTGKTHICIATCLFLTEQCHEQHYYFSYRREMPALIKAMKSYNDDYEKAMSKWRTCNNLYIDDLFKLAGKMVDGKLTDIDRNELKIVYDLVNSRYLNNLTTIFSSEYSVKEITDIDTATGSRIYDMVKPYGMLVTGANERLVSMQNCRAI